MKDLFGKAILDFAKGKRGPVLTTETNISEPEEFDVAYLFRTYAKMPEIERQALKQCFGKILDVGSGAGSHALHLQEMGHNVTAIDQSSSAIEACIKRGVKNAVCSDVASFGQSGFDTVLLLMNGVGLAGTLDCLPSFLLKLKSFLSEGGQILLDSSDIIYMFDKDQDGGHWIPGDGDYYGELTFTLTYDGVTEEPFKWLYADYRSLFEAASQADLQCEMIYVGDHYDFLAKLTAQPKKKLPLTR
jgi:SAM-dependent methyltransferase